MNFQNPDDWDESQFNVYGTRGNGCYGNFQYPLQHHIRATENLKKVLKPLIYRFRASDVMRCRLQQRGGTVGDLDRFTHLLNEHIEMEDGYQKHVVSLSNQQSLKSALADIGGWDLRLQVRQLENRMPVYYLCRIYSDYWAEYNLIVEDLYLSPDYPMDDERFVKLMSAGHENYHLRLSQFRNRIGELLREKTDETEIDHLIDRHLYALGRNIFQAAWHEDQRLGVLAARHFDMPNFNQAIELLYLCLSGELCELRNAVNADMMRFFEEIYPQPAIRGFLESLKKLPGSALNDVPRIALKWFSTLTKAFAGFLRVEVVWGCRKVTVPLHKVVFANANRMNLVAGNLLGNDAILNASKVLESEARRAIESLVSFECHG